jgi:DNA-binding Lrp family transcriptional regulator
MFIEPAEKENVLAALSNIEEIHEVYEVTGECDLVSIVSTPCIEDFRELLHKQILHIKGIKSTIIAVVLKLHDKCTLERYITSSNIHNGKDD